MQRLLYSEMAINQCQTGIDDSVDIPPEMFDNDRVKLGKKGNFLITVICTHSQTCFNRRSKDRVKSISESRWMFETGQFTIEMIFGNHTILI